MEDVMHIITAAEAPRFQLPGVEFIGYAAPSRGSGRLCAWQIRVDAGLVSPASHTIDEDEVFLITSGVLQLCDAGPRLSTGDCAIVPAGTPILLSNPGDE